MPLEQQDLELFAEKLANAMVKAQVEAIQTTDTFTKIKKGAANMAISAAGALVAFMMLSWFGEYRDQSKLAAENSKEAAVSALDAKTNAKLARTQSEEAVAVANSAVAAFQTTDARITALTDKVAELSLTQPGVSASDIPASSFQERRDELLKAQDKAMYRQQQAAPKATK